MLGKITIAILFFILPGFGGLAQKMEMPDYRTKKESFTKMSDKTLRADLGVFTIGGIEESLNKLPLKKFSPHSYTKNFMSFKGENNKGEKIEVSVTTGPFAENGRKIMRVEDDVVKIAGKPYYGDYGNLPRTEIKSVQVLIGKDTVVIPPLAYGDLYNLNFTYKDKSGTERTANGVFLSKDKEESRMYIYLLSRDATGSYEVTWIIENKQYLRRVMDYGFTK